MSLRPYWLRLAAPIGVSVQSKHGQFRSRVDGARRAILGDGLLERARAMSLGLLGLTTAVGLAIVALALNQSWPLIAGSSIPSIPSLHQDVGEATIAAGVAHDSGAQSSSADGGGGSSEARGMRKSGSGGTRPDTGSVPSTSTELVVSPSAPAKPRDGRDDGESDQQNPAPATQPKRPSRPPAAPSPATELVSAPPPPETPAPATPTPATASGAPDESSTPPWSNGDGHAYGRDDDWDDDDDHDWDDYDRDWDDDADGDDDHDWGGHGRHRDRD